MRVGVLTWKFSRCEHSTEGFCGTGSLEYDPFFRLAGALERTRASLQGVTLKVYFPAFRSASVARRVTTLSTCRRYVTQPP